MSDLQRELEDLEKAFGDRMKPVPRKPSPAPPGIPRKLQEVLSEGDAEGKLVTARGTVDRIFYSSSTWVAGRLLDSEGLHVGFAGKLSVAEGDAIIIVGIWTHHPKYDWQIAVTSYSLDLHSPEGLARVLEKCDAFRGIGASRAAAIVAAANGKFEDLLRENPQELARLAKVPEAVILNLQTEWFAKIGLNQTMAALATWEVSPAAAKRLYEAFGENVVNLVKRNPYWLIGRVPGFAFRSIDKIALATGIPKNHPERIREGILYTLEDNTNSGHTWMADYELARVSEELLALDTLAEAASIKSTIAELRASGRIIGHAVGNLTCLWPADLLKDEVAVAKAFRTYGAASYDTFGKVAPADTLAYESRLDESQQAAVATALTYRLSVITGGAGAGKSFLASAIREAFTSLGLRVSVCAPTGKAAQRLKDFGLPAKTIHRLLEPERVDSNKGELEFKFSRGKDNKLEADLIIVDEFSMVDVRLAARLFEAINWTRTTVVLVGDHNQLPSVGPGALLRDLVDRRHCPVTVLGTCHRQAGILKHRVHSILGGVVGGTVDSPVDPPANANASAAGARRPLGPWYVIGNRMEPATVKEFLEFMFTKRLLEYSIEDARQASGYRPIDPVWDVQLITPTHKGPIGTVELNRFLQKINQASKNREVPEPRREGDRPPFMVDDKVIQMKNDYDLQIMNGTIGKVLEIEYGRGRTHGHIERMTVDFDGVPTEVSSEKLKNVAFAYAVTVHKYQGSEVPICVFVCHKSHTFMHHRGLIYTAASRARQTAFIVGDSWAIRNCAERVDSSKRQTLMSLPTDTVERILEDPFGEKQKA